MNYPIIFSHALNQSIDAYQKFKETVKNETDAIFAAYTQMYLPKVVDLMDRIAKINFQQNPASFWRMFGTRVIDPEIDGRGDLISSQHTPKTNILAAAGKWT